MGQNEAATLGYVLLALASLVGLAAGVKQLLKGETNGNGNGNGNGKHDVTRREFEEVKQYLHANVHELRNEANAARVRLTRLEARQEFAAMQQRQREESEEEDLRLFNPDPERGA